MDQAVFVLGHQAILRWVLKLTLEEAMLVPLPAYAVEANELWEHSLTTAIAAEIVFAQGPVLKLNPASAFTIGLLHDIGKLVLGQALTPKMQADIRNCVHLDHLARAEAEKQILGTDHAEVGAQLLRRWRLPDYIVEAVANHHAPILGPQPGISVLAHLADCLAHLVGSAPGWEAYAVRVYGAVMDMFHLTQNKLEAMLISIGEENERIHLSWQADNSMKLTLPQLLNKP